MIIAILLIAVFLGIGGYAFTTAYADHTAMTVRLAEISAQNRLELAPYVLTALVIVAVAVVLIFYFRRPPVVNDHRTVFLMLPNGQSRRQAYKSLGTYEALALAPGGRIEQLENENVKLLKGG